jgi:hypothetical protein
VLALARAALFGTGFQRWSLYGSHSSRALASPAFGGCSFLRDSRGERHSAVQRSPRSHSSASLRSRSAVALSSWARASLRYRIARALLMATQTPRNRARIQVQEKHLVPGSAGEPCACAGRTWGPAGETRTSDSLRSGDRPFKCLIVDRIVNWKTESSGRILRACQNSPWGIIDPVNAARSMTAASIS